jgi:Zn-dependent protease with chaperone function
MRARGGYYDGRVAVRREVSLDLDGGMLHIRGEGVGESCRLEEVIVTPGVGSILRTLRFSDGSSCELADHAFVTHLERLQGKGGRATLLHRWEKSLPLALGALLLTALVVLLFLRFGVPVMARQVAFRLPPAAETSMGRETMAILDRLLLKPSRLDQGRRRELEGLFHRVAGGGAGTAGYRLEFRSSDSLGANAFALPGGIVVLTDGLVELARSDDEIAAVLAHEVGHVRHRHILRHVLQNSVTGLLVATLTGDLTSITSLSATLPTAIVDASFSRQFEREADDAAIAWMKSAGVDPRRYAEILARLQAQLDTRSGETFEPKSPIHNYLSNHPDTGERIRRVLASGQPGGG